VCRHLDDLNNAPKKRRYHDEKVVTIGRRIDKARKKREEERERFVKRAARQVFCMRTVLLGRGQCLVFDTGRCVFTGQKSIEEVEADRAELEGLILPNVAGMKI